MSKVLYFLATFAESGLSVFGIRGTYEQPSYRVVRTLAGAEITEANIVASALNLDLEAAA